MTAAACLCNCEYPCVRGFSCDNTCRCFPCEVCHPSYFEGNDD